MAGRRIHHLSPAVDVVAMYHRILLVAAARDDPLASCCFDSPRLELQTTLYPLAPEYQRACYHLHAAVVVAAATHYYYLYCTILLGSSVVAACVAPNEGLPFVVVVAVAAAVVARMEADDVVVADADAADLA